MRVGSNSVGNLFDGLIYCYRTHSPSTQIFNVSNRSFLVYPFFLSAVVPLPETPLWLIVNSLPKNFIPEFRFFLGAAVSSGIAIVDRSATGHENAMYTTRLSLDSLWKVGRKRGWWKGVRGGDVGMFVVALAVFSILFDAQRSLFAKDSSMLLIRLLRGDIEVGLKNKGEGDEDRSGEAR